MNYQCQRYAQERKIQKPQIWTDKNVRSLNPSVISLCDSTQGGGMGSRIQVEVKEKSCVVVGIRARCYT